MDENNEPLTNELGQPIKKEVVICYVSTGTNKHERNYGATQLELLAVVWATHHFCHYLLGQPFKLETDHTAIKWLLNQQDISGILARYII